MENALAEFLERCGLRSLAEIARRGQPIKALLQVVVRPRWRAPKELLPKLPEFGSGEPTDNQLAALKTLGLDGANLNAEQVSIILSAREYADAIMERIRLPDMHYKDFAYESSVIF